MEEIITNTNKVSIQLTEENKQLKHKIEILEAKYNKLLEYSKLDDNDINREIKSDKALTQFVDMMNVFSEIYKVRD